MLRLLMFFLLISPISAAAESDHKEDRQRARSYLYCAALATYIPDAKEDMKRLFLLGVAAVDRVTAAAPDDVETLFFGYDLAPVASSADFIKGFLWHSAIRDAVAKVQQPDPARPNARLFESPEQRAASEFDLRNCKLL